MYPYEWIENNIYSLSKIGKIEKEIRPVFKEELDYFEMYKVWDYPDTKLPLLWAEGIRRYIVDGQLVAEAKGGGFYTKPKIKVIEKNLKLTPIDIEALWEQNENLMLGLIRTSRDLIRNTYEDYMPLPWHLVAAKIHCCYLI